MAKRKEKPSPKNQEPNPSDTWIPMRTGLIIITITSLALAVWVDSQASESVGWGERILWGGAFGGSVWVIFLLVFLFNRWVRRR